MQRLTAIICSNLRYELKQIQPRLVDTVQIAIQAYMDGVWVQHTQTKTLKAPSQTREEAEKFLNMLIENSN